SEDDLMGPNFEVEYDLRFHEHYSFAVSGGLFEGDHRSRDGSKLKLDVYHVEGHARLHSGPKDFGDFFAGAGVTFMFLDIEGATRDPAINFGALNTDDTSEIGYGAFIEFGWEIPVHENINIVIEDRLGIDRTSTDLNLPGQKSSTGWFTGNLFQVGLQVAF
ncbi:MAG: autotransporter outer membrane beta-barrel domain-containing protein, partial [Candidatus Methylomirabilis sp.]|nr:autotransporter outer membrane beta-barrel domain-containing protein [Deltaproteobacteria bacterium]